MPPAKLSHAKKSLAVNFGNLLMISAKRAAPVAGRLGVMKPEKFDVGDE
jgi:hypothetical protein